MTVSLSQVRTYLLAKHHLLDRDGADVSSVADDLVGLHATSNVTPYLSLFNRIERFSPDDLDRDLYRRKSLVRIRAMRGTFFLFTRRLLPIATEATQFPEERISRSLAHAGISTSEFEKLAKLILSCLASSPKTLPEIKRDVSRESSRSLDWKRGRRVTRRTNLGVVLQLLLIQRRVQSQPEQIEWKSIDWDGYGTRTFTRIRKVTYRPVSTTDTGSTNEGEAKVKLAEYYVKQYGPVTADDIAWWMDESKPEVLRLLARLPDKLTSIRIQGYVDPFLQHPDHLRVLQKTREVDDCVRFLPYEDPYAKSRRLREFIIPKTSERQVYPMGNALPTVISNGIIVGTWNIMADEETGTVNVKRIAPIKRMTTRRIVEEGQRLGAFLFSERPVTVSFAR